jgi:hypothetical protein
MRGDFRLRVADEGLDNELVAPDDNPVLAHRRWMHHRFNLWEHLLVFRILRHFNNFDGLHLAGDWTESIGQNAAIRSGLRAACAVGLSQGTKQFLIDIEMDPAEAFAC